MLLRTLSPIRSVKSPRLDARNHLATSLPLEVEPNLVAAPRTCSLSVDPAAGVAVGEADGLSEAEGEGVGVGVGVAWASRRRTDGWGGCCILGLGKGGISDY